MYSEPFQTLMSILKETAAMNLPDYKALYNQFKKEQPFIEQLFCDLAKDVESNELKRVFCDLILSIWRFYTQKGLVSRIGKGHYLAAAEKKQAMFDYIDGDPLRDSRDRTLKEIYNGRIDLDVIMYLKLWIARERDPEADINEWLESSSFLLISFFCYLESFELVTRIDTQSHSKQA